MNALKFGVRHRPLSLPQIPWVMTQTWHDILFIHWPMPIEKMTRYVPSELQVHSFNGVAWLGIVLFRAKYARGRFMPPIPFFHRYNGINVRTYVTVKGKPGVYFFSLYTNHPIFTVGARYLFRLPYFYTHIHIEKNHKQNVYICAHKGKKNVFRIAYEPLAHHKTKTKLTSWLLERYRLYTVSNGNVYYVDIHHKPWEVEAVQANIHTNTILDRYFLKEQLNEPSIHYAKKQQALFWPLRRNK